MPTRPESPRDDAYSDTLGVVLMVVLTGAMTAGLYVSVFGLGAAEEAPDELKLAGEGKVSAQGTKRFAVAGAPEGLTWASLLLRVDGRELSYDAALTGPYKFCVARDEGRCLGAAEFAAAPLKVEAGQTLHVHDPRLEGETLEVVQRETGETLVRIVA